MVPLIKVTIRILNIRLKLGKKGRYNKFVKPAFMGLKRFEYMTEGKVCDCIEPKNLIRQHLYSGCPKTSFLDFWI